MSDKRPWTVTTETQQCSFATFAAAETWARRRVADSARDEFAIRASIHGPGISAWVSLDGSNRVWTDIQ